MEKIDVIILGAGLSGALLAYLLAKEGKEVALISAGDSSSSHAQGGIAYSGKGDSEKLFSKDILRAGAGLSNPKAVKELVTKGPSYIEDLLIKSVAVPFDRKNHQYDLATEGAHSVPRVLHHKDVTGRIIMEKLFEKLQHFPNVSIRKKHTAIDLITLSHHSQNKIDIYEPSTCVGVYVLDDQKNVHTFLAKETVLATGGCSEVYLHSTNPQTSRGDGIAMAYRAGARIMNLEYIQFHPTALYIPHERRFLLSEALRGEGAVLLNSQKESFMQNYHELQSLAPRDVVSRAIYQEMVRDKADHLWLDMTMKKRSYLQDRFPYIFSHLEKKQFDLSQNLIPIVPAAHYSCGGIAVDLQGRTSIRRLRAIGEVSCTGVHGANRLASTSLLEAVVWTKNCAEDLLQKLTAKNTYFPPVQDWKMCDKHIDPALIQQDWMSIKHTMWNYVGLIRDRTRLSRAKKMLQDLKWEIESFYEKAVLTPDLIGLRNGILLGELITTGAIRNRDSLGCHYRIN